MNTSELVVRPLAAPIVKGRKLAPLIAAVLLGVTSLYAVTLWLDLRAAWLHPELYGSSQYIWNHAYEERTWNRLRKALDWKAFDPNVNRVRPLSDLADTIDTIARPYQTWLVGPHPSITPIALITAIGSPLALFLFFRLAGFDAVKSAVLVALFISSVGFLSVLVDYIRPAKKLTMLSFCLALYLAQRHARTGERWTYGALLGTLFFGFFTDELALGTLPIIGLLFLPSLLRATPRWKQAAFLALPVAFVVTVAWVLPVIYAAFSVHGAWNALTDANKIGLFDYLADPDFYRYTVLHVTEAVLTTVGTHTHVLLTEMLAFAAAVGVTLVLVLPLRRWLAVAPISPTVRYGLVASVLSILALGAYATLLDFYPDPSHIGERSYLGAFTYYYHTPLVIPIVLWLGFAWEALSHLAVDRPVGRRAVLAGGVLAGCLMIVGNFSTFAHVNQLVQIIHTYPYSSASMFRALEEKRAEIRAAGRRDTVVIEFTREPELLSRTYDEQLQAVFGPRWQDNEFYSTFNEFKATPIMKDGNLNDFVHAYYPWTSFDVRIRE